MQIGTLKIDHNVILAPMSGVTDWPFRQMVRSLG
ncbi:MAG: tRNA dihydrouridine synthase DusB, partial [Candidatus Puniceispirillales bacterium]